MLFPRITAVNLHDLRIVHFGTKSRLHSFPVCSQVDMDGTTVIHLAVLR